MENIKGLVLDMDGVIWRNKVPIGNLPAIFERIDKMGLGFVFATNNSTRTVSEYTDILQNLGINASPRQILTSGSITAAFLAAQHPAGGEVFVVGMQGLKDTLRGAGFVENDQDPLAVVVGLDTNLDYQTLRKACSLVLRGIPFIGTNPDVALPTPNGLVPGTGSILAAITAVTDIEPTIMGKPRGLIYEEAIRALNLPFEQILAIGDRLETDILGAQQAGAKTGLVLTGVTKLEEAQAWVPEINIISESLETLIEEIHED